MEMFVLISYGNKPTDRRNGGKSNEAIATDSF